MRNKEYSKIRDNILKWKYKTNLNNTYCPKVSSITWTELIWQNSQCWNQILCHYIHLYLIYSFPISLKYIVYQKNRSRSLKTKIGPTGYIEIQSETL